ncbi:PepSY domain-containing protein [Entomomonas sp. E2T0]|uniref:PepSY-associated TM helix domain-containing protein n=1 Tax=Entomomonas sp. E2T0 TaxID=2930213 RepID=UPI0022282308|nr:PepSY-associated TM helix domain-containing protein [Entomomonas sp. E2T0]UYZ84188.1 PepSY domain-containing protein [Entomomonas sp. E2T0]
MKEGFRQSQAWLHTWSGLIVGWLLFMIFATGTLSFFREEITYWMQPELHSVSLPKDENQAVILERVFRQLSPKIEDASFLAITLPSDRNPTLKVNWFAARQRGNLVFDPNTGNVIKPRATVGGNFYYRMHYQLWYLSPFTGRIIICVVTLCMLIALITGIITHKKIFKDFFVLRTHKGQRSWLDGHIISGVIALPFHLMITFSGLIILIGFFMPWGNDAVYGQQRGKIYQEAFNIPDFGERASGIKQSMPSISSLLEQFNKVYPNQQLSFITIYRPNQTNSKIVLTTDIANTINPKGLVFNNQGEIVTEVNANGPAAATQNTLSSLHRGHFANYGLRWLYFLSGIAGCFMTASGLILWFIKKQARLKKTSPNKQPFSHRLVQILNVTTIAGLCVALPSVLLTNRLLPTMLEHRQRWEAHIFFIIWGLTLLYSIIRPYKKAWYELFALATITCLAIPIINSLTTKDSLFQSITQGNWQLASVELIAITFALLFAWLSYMIFHHNYHPKNHKVNSNAQLQQLVMDK